MTDLMKRYEAETGLNLEQAKYAWKTFDYFTAYIAWLESQLTWRPVSEKPAKGQSVLIKYLGYCGYCLVALGSYIRRFEEEAEYCDNEDVIEHRDEDDMDYYLEGWYEESRYGEYDSYLIRETVIGWLPIPKEGV